MNQKMKPISVYCKQEVDGWIRLPDILNMTYPGYESYSCSFLNEKEGIHFIASVRDFGALQKIHVSISPIMSMHKDKTESEMVNQIIYKSENIIKKFFGDLVFSLAPDDQRRPIVKHFFHTIDNR